MGKSKIRSLQNRSGARGVAERASQPPELAVPPQPADLTISTTAALQTSLASRPAVLARLQSSPEFWPYFAGSCLYWLLRILYFSTAREKIFSDIAVYCGIADNIISHWYFGVGNFYCYYSPGAPVAIAISKLLAGASFALFYPYLVSLLAFLGILLTAREIAFLTRRRYLGIGYLYIMALLKPSLFWQLKLSTEGIAEALLQLTLGLALLAFRRQSTLLSFTCGLALASLFLTRPQYLVSLPFLLLFFWGAAFDQRGFRLFLAHCWRQALQLARHPLPGLRVQHAFLAFSLGVVILWLPWMTRNYLHYHRIIPVSLSGAMSSIWEYGLYPVKPGSYTSITMSNGEVVPNGITGLIARADRLPSDLQYYDFILELAHRWFGLNYQDFWVAVLSRAVNILGANDAGGLTSLSRDYLFPWPFQSYSVPYPQQSPLNVILIDKTPFLMLLGIVGLVMLSLRFSYRMVPLLGLVLVIWLVPAFTLGYPRAVDALVGPTIFGCFYLITAVVERSRSV